ncbi:MAG: DegT/DnrJ/EryC1/StrS family aminotransferase [Phycisphaerae bacterium]|nr:DegT/DnrJ/EryC1/StrS family aminotransferase [Phycisphaerae bacterium]MDD5380304.1 DegT/DnrJ/EryC1/StrS family aminotransferase [Phycisphaerae bacterium]
MRVHLSRPDITEKEIEAVCEVLRTPNLSLGPKVPEFEVAFAKYIGRKRAVAVNSGTSGLFLCASALGIGPGDEVIVPPFTFIASANTIMMTGAKPVFVDIDPKTLNIDPTKIQPAITKKTKAIMPVEAFGSPADFDKICQIAKKNNLTIIEDSCEALGSELNGKKAGTFGKMSAFAFYPNKQITTGEGGIILTDDDDLADMCVSLRNQGRGTTGAWLSHERLGYNYRISDINCALGIVQLSRIDEIKAKRAAVAKWYQEMLAGDDRLVVPTEPPGCDISWFVFVVRLAGSFSQKHRDKVIEAMKAGGIQVAVYFTPVHLQPFMAEQFGCKKGDFPVTESVAERTIALPFYNNLTKDDIALVCDELRKAVSHL